jgi:filamentous hemagglutinin family protein
MKRHASVNRIYRLVWSRGRSAWVAVAETSRRRGKSGRTSSASSAVQALAAALSLALMPLAHASPTNGQVVSGKGSISQSGETTTIRQSSQNLSINWQSFNIAPLETVDFLQPDATAIAVNRIFSANGSVILGHLEANGQVYLINPNGIVFGAGAEVNVGGLVASTLDVNQASLGGSTPSFEGSGAGSVVNQGTITAVNGGSVALLGSHVANQSVITAQLGTVALAAGSAVTLTFNGASLVHLQVDQSVLKSLAQNGGVIRADGGKVILTAGAKDTLLASAVNNTGVIEARTVQNQGGTITLLGGMLAGTVNAGGTLDASAPDGGPGGRIETSAAHVEVAEDLKVTTASSQGLFGSWLIDPQDFTVAASGGDITGAALSSELGTTSVTLQSSSGSKSGSGNVNVNDAVAWSANTTLTLTASNNVNVNASLTAKGAAAGLAINPNTANGPDSASGTGVFNLGSGATINLRNVSPTSTTALVISGIPYTVINSLGAPGSTTGTDLQGVNGNLSGYYALGSNIDATATASWNAQAGFTPIGNSATNFTGTFDGLGHTVSLLTINLPTTNDVGLFGALGSAAVLRNVGLIAERVSAEQFVGGLVGLTSGSVDNSFAWGSVSGTGDVGGLAGYNVGALSHSDSKGGVRGSSYVGGLVGFNGAGTVSSSYATDSVIGTGSNVGGLAGWNSGAVSNSYATGKVSGGSSSVGGLVGSNFSGAAVNDSFASGAVRGTNNVGGLVGYNDVGTVSDSYATGNVSGTASVGGLVGQNYGNSISGSHATGAVSGSDSVGGLVGTSTIDASVSGVIAVSDSYATGRVSGGSNVGGLIGANYGEVSNSYATGNVSGANNIGGLMGYNSRLTVSNSYARGSVSSTGTDAGGLVGANYGGTLSDSYSTGAVSGSGNVGGLVGFTNDSGIASNSFWDVTTSGQSSSAGGTGMTTAQMQTEANFTSATAANGNVNPDWDFTNTWVMRDGHTYPLLVAFLTPLTVSANVSADGNRITLKDAAALTAMVDRQGATSLTSSGARKVSGTGGTNLATDTTAGTTTLGMTTVNDVVGARID